MYANKKRMNREMAVSPIVATLVLIVVAVIGAVAVGTIMGTFSSDVSKQASAGQAASASSTNILFAGSTTIQPAMNLVAADYMAANPGVKITVQGGGSGAGLQSVAAGIADVGLFSQAMDTKQVAAYPTIKQYVVGYGGVVAIVNNKLANSTTAYTNVTYADLKTVFTTGSTANTNTLPAGITAVEVRSDVSGTADSFATLIGDSNIYDTSKGQIGNNGNGAEVTAVAGNAGAIGFTDLDYALTASGITILPYTGTPSTDGLASSVKWPAYTWQSVRDAKNGVSNPLNFPATAVRPLELLTNGQPSTLENNIIQFTSSPSEAAQFHSINLVHVSDIVTL